MKSTSSRFTALLIIDIVILLMCAYGLYIVSIKANLPFSVTANNSFLTLENILGEYSHLSVGDTIKAIDNYQFNNWQEIELYLDGKNIGETVQIAYLDYGRETVDDIKLVNYYSLSDLIIMGVVGLAFIVFAILIRFKAQDNQSAIIFHWASVGLAIVIVCTAGNYSGQPSYLGYLIRIIWFIAYSITPVLFIHFTLSFVNLKFRRSRLIINFLYSIAILNSIILTYLFINYITEPSLKKIINYNAYFEEVFRVFVIACVIVAISVCIYAFKKCDDRDERKRIQWLLLGFFTGPFSFVLFWLLPIIFLGYSLIPEFLILILLVAIPITFGIAIVKYHLLDINFLVSRGVLYTVVLAGLIITFIVVSSVFAFLFQKILPVQEMQTTVPFIISAVLVALMLQPAKSKIQIFIDKKFFRLEYDFREEQKKYIEEIKNVNSINELAQKLVHRTNELIPVEKIGFFVVEKPDTRIKLLSHKGFEILVGRSLRFEAEKLKTDLSIPIAIGDKVEKGSNIEFADINVFKRWGMVLVLPIKSVTGEIHAFLVLGAKKSGKRYFKDDIDLLNTVTAASAIAIDRTKVQEELILEKLEAERLEELNKMKSFFVSSLTHELRTPLTAMKMHIELLQNQKVIAPEKKDDYLNILDGESEKLDRLIDNILDFAKIEKGMKTYKLEKTELNEILTKTVDAMQYQFRINKQICKYTECKNENFINADADAVERAIINLLTNSVKYSSPDSVTTVSVSQNNGTIIIKIQDEGKGIPADEIDDIFKPYFRSKNEADLEAKGTGLGLAIVKHIMGAHQGNILVESTPGKGSTFSLIFPLMSNV